MPNYTYLAVNSATGRILGELPLSNVSYERRLSSAGAFSAELSFMDPATYNLDVFGSTVVNNSSLLILRDGSPAWGGMIWSRKTNSKGVLALTGSETWSYFSRSFMDHDIVFGQWDQLDIVCNLFDWAMRPAGSFKFPQPPYGQISGVKRDLLVPMNKSVRQAVEDLAAGDNGFEFVMNPLLLDNQHMGSEFKMGYPQLGRQSASSMGVYDWPGTILDWDWPEDGNGISNDVFGTGGGAGATPISTRARDDVALAAGALLLQEVNAYSDVTDPLILQDRVNADLKAASRPGGVPTVTVRGDQLLGTVFLGDTVTLQINIGPASISGRFRLVSYKVTPESAGGEVVSLGVW